MVAAMPSTRATGLPLGFRIGGVVIQLFGLVLSAGITALIVDLLITARTEHYRAEGEHLRGTA